MATTPNPAPTSASSCPTPGCPTAAPSARRRATTSTSPSPCGLNPAFRSPKATPRGRCTWPLRLLRRSDGSGPVEAGLRQAGRPARPLGDRGQVRQARAAGYWYSDRDTTATGGWHDFVIHVRVQPGPSGRGPIEIWHRDALDKPNYVKENFIQDNGAASTTVTYATLLEPCRVPQTWACTATRRFTSTPVMLHRRPDQGRREVRERRHPARGLNGTRHRANGLVPGAN